MTNHDNNKKIEVLILKRGDHIIESLINFCSKHNIASANIQAIGAVSWAELALYDLDKKEYHKTKLSGPLEICAINGNIGMLDNKTTAHLHAVLSDKDMNTKGGHLVEATVAATCEITIARLGHNIIRKYDKDIGLNLITE